MKKAKSWEVTDEYWQRAGYNIRWLLRAIAQQVLGFWRSLFLRLTWVATAASHMLAITLRRFFGGFNVPICQVEQN